MAFQLEWRTLFFYLLFLLLRVYAFVRAKSQMYYFNAKINIKAVHFHLLNQ